jgi:tetratricopeptide (TPR) repeat protein
MPDPSDPSGRAPSGRDASDDVVGAAAWTLDGETRTLLRLEKLRAAVAAGEWDEVELEAEELLDEAPDHGEALFLLGEASIALGRFEVAREAYQRILAVAAPETPGEQSAVLVGHAVACYHTCQLAQAAESAREAIRLDPENAEGHHVLGLSLEHSPGRASESVGALLAAARLDPERFPLPIAPPTTRSGDHGWEEIIGQALERVAPEVRQFWARVPFRVEDLPDLEELRRHEPPISPAIPVLYAGTPPSFDEDALDGEDDGDDAPPADTHPTAIRLYARNLGRTGSFEAMVDRIAEALEDERQDWLPPE